MLLLRRGLQLILGVVQCNLEKVCLFRSQGGLCFNHGHQIVFQYFLDGALVNEFFIVFGKVIQENRVEVVCIKKHRKFKLLVVVQLEVFFLELTEQDLRCLVKDYVLDGKMIGLYFFIDFQKNVDRDDFLGLVFLVLEAGFRF